jgi:hypothetical protein
MEIKEVREGEARQNEEASQDIDDILSPSEIFLDLLQPINEVKNEKDQGDQNKRE